MENCCPNENTLLIEKPWLDERGRPLSDDKLRALPAEWDAATWESYLQSIEVGRVESLVSPRQYEAALDRQEQPVFAFAQSHANDGLRGEMTTLLKRLTPQQKKIIEMTFWQGFGDVRVSKELGICRRTVRTVKRRILRKLAKGIGKVSPSHRLMGGEMIPLNRKAGGRGAGEIRQMAEGEDQEAV